MTAELGTYKTSIASRYVSVPVGGLAPQPATGYAVSPKLFTLYGLDWYLEYELLKGEFTPG